MKAKIVTVTYYTNPEYSDRDSVIPSFYEDVSDMDVEHLMQSLEGFIVDTSIFRDKEDELKECLRAKNYKRYYKIIKKMAKRAIKSLKE